MELCIIISILLALSLWMMVKPTIDALRSIREKGIELKLASSGSINKEKSEATVRFCAPYFKVDGKIINPSGYDKYVVDGTSMKRFNVPDGSVVFASKIQKSDFSEKEAPILVLKTDKTDGNKIEYKLRKFRGIYDFASAFNDWIGTHPELDGEKLKLKFEEKKQAGKIDECRTKGCRLLVSETTKNEEPDYSFHPENRITGRVQYVLPSENITILKKY